MSITISNNGTPQFAQAAGSTGNGSASTATPAGSASVASPASDQLKLTDSARALQQAALHHDASAIDPQRVEQVRQALASGSYQVNPGRIADRMLALEQQISGTGKV